MNAWYVAMSLPRARFLQHHQLMNLSGRSLRRLPVLALAQHIGSSSFAQPCLSGTASENSTSQGTGLEVWLDGLSEVIKSHASEHDKVV